MYCSISVLASVVALNNVVASSGYKDKVVFISYKLLNKQLAAGFPVIKYIEMN